MAPNFIYLGIFSLYSVWLCYVVKNVYHVYLNKGSYGHDKVSVRLGRVGH